MILAILPMVIYQVAAGSISCQAGGKSGARASYYFGTQGLPSKKGLMRYESAFINSPMACPGGNTNYGNIKKTKYYVAAPFGKWKCGTKLTLTNLMNQRQINVIVMDRCGRCGYDLSLDALLELDPSGNNPCVKATPGHIQPKVEALPPLAPEQQQVDDPQDTRNGCLQLKAVPIDSSDIRPVAQVKYCHTEGRLYFRKPEDPKIRWYKIEGFSRFKCNNSPCILKGLKKQPKSLTLYGKKTITFTLTAPQHQPLKPDGGHKDIDGADPKDRGRTDLERALEGITPAETK
jgi:hypothetical protein